VIRQLSTSIGAAAFFFVGAIAPAQADSRDSSATSGSWAQNELEVLLVAAAEHPDQRPAFIKALLASELCALTDKPDEGQDANSGAKVLGYKAPDGLPATPLFTSPARATDAFGEGSRLACAKGAVLLAAVRQSRVVIDPGESYGIMFTPEELDHILGVERTVTSPTNVQLGNPRETPTQLVEHLRTAIASEAGIKHAWLALAYWPDKKEWSWYLDVRTELDRARVLALLRDAAMDADMQGKPMDIVINDLSKPPGVGIAIDSR
jgi:hypothetical protein